MVAVDRVSAVLGLTAVAVPRLGSGTDAASGGGLSIERDGVQVSNVLGPKRNSILKAPADRKLVCETRPVAVSLLGLIACLQALELLRGRRCRGKMSEGLGGGRSGQAQHV